MIVTIEYSEDGDRKTTDPMDNITDLTRDPEENLVVTNSDGTRSTFIDGKIAKASQSPDTHRTIGNGI